MSHPFKIGDIVRCVEAASPLWEHRHYKVLCVGYSSDGTPRIGVSEQFPNTAAWNASRFVKAEPNVKHTTDESRRGPPDYTSVTRSIVRGS